MWGKYCCLTIFSDCQCGPKFTIIVGHVEEILLFNSVFPFVNMCLNCEDIAQQSCAMVPRWRIFGDFFASCISSGCVQHVSDLHLKFALRSHHCVEVWCTSNLRRLRLGEKKERKKIGETTGQKYIYICPVVSPIFFLSFFFLA